MYDKYLNLLHVKCSKISYTSCMPNKLDKQRRSLIRVYPVCYSDKHFVNSNLDNQHFIFEQKEKSVCNFCAFTIVAHSLVSE